MVNIFYVDISKYELNSKDFDSLFLARKEYVKSIKDEKRKKQSLLVWKLLEFAISSIYGVVETNFYAENGKWVDRNGLIKFSLSHSNNIVAVGVSDTEIGVDVEMISSKILKLKEKVFLPENVENLQEYLTLKWTEKESFYKANNKGNFISKLVCDMENKYYITTCCKDTNCNFIKIELNKIIL